MGRPILFSKAILLTAFIPLYTLQRVEGRIFRPMALTLTFALIAGTVFAMFVVPALASFAVRGGIAEHESWIVRWLVRLYRPGAGLRAGFNASRSSPWPPPCSLARGPHLRFPGQRIPAQTGRRRPLGAHLRPESISPSEAAKLAQNVRQPPGLFPRSPLHRQPAWPPR